MKTHFETNENAKASRKWFLVDAENQRVGRLASEIAKILRGKNNPRFTPHNDTGDFVVVVNAEKVSFSGQKMEQKEYHHHTGYVGGLKTETAAELLERKPAAILEKAVKGMMPKTALGRNQLKKLKVYSGTEHPHAAQQPESISFN